MEFSQLFLPQYRIWWLAGGFFTATICHAVACYFLAYPLSFERQLKQGKHWVYIPQRWRGFHKARALWLSRLLIVLTVSLGVMVFTQVTGKRVWTWQAGMAMLLLLIVYRLNSFWVGLRYRQQEDTYFQLHDTLRDKLESEGKDYTETAFRNLAAYQHHNLLRKADENGRLLPVLRQQARLSRERRKSKHAATAPVEG